LEYLTTSKQREVSDGLESTGKTSRKPLEGIPSKIIRRPQKEGKVDGAPDRGPGKDSRRYVESNTRRTDS
jgi:hypothetical protein